MGALLLRAHRDQTERMVRQMRGDIQSDDEPPVTERRLATVTFSSMCWFGDLALDHDKHAFRSLQGAFVRYNPNHMKLLSSPTGATAGCPRTRFGLPSQSADEESDLILPCSFCKTAR